jgi:hypothetical protein
LNGRTARIARRELRPRSVVLALAIAWCAAFPLVGVPAELHFFADGSLFSYAVAADNAWSFHWRQIPGRLAAYLWASWPGQEWGLLTGDPSAGVAVYAALNFLAPAAGLAAVWAADRAGTFTSCAALSSSLLCPVLFGFPTELWISHAAIWPAFALLWRVAGHVRWAIGTVALGIVILSHEAGVIWALTLLAALIFAPDGSQVRRRALLSFGLAMLVWAACELLIRPDPYEAEVLGRNAWNLVRLSSLAVPLTLTIASALFLYCIVLAFRVGPRVAFAVTAGALMLFWAFFDTTLHARDRYYSRTLVLGAVPVLVLLTALRASDRARMTRDRWSAAIPAAIGALLLVTLVHMVETAKFVIAWREYVAAIRHLALGEDADPALGFPDFVSSARLSTHFERLSWQSTTPFLSVLVSDRYAPRRLVVDPQANYFWFDCTAASANATAVRAVPMMTREMIRRYTCLHR